MSAPLIDSVCEELGGTIEKNEFGFFENYAIAGFQSRARDDSKIISFVDDGGESLKPALAILVG